MLFRSFISGPQKGIKFGNASADPCTNAGAAADNSYDLGGSSIRYKDLYLSGGVLLGGTGATNKLDDYEEGNWTPVLDFGGGSTGITYGTQAGRYTKIGRVVYFSFRIYLTSKGSSTGHAHISGFPFTVANMPTGGVFQLVPARGWFGTNDEPMYIYFNDGGTRLAMYYNDWDATANSAAANGQFANNTEIELTAFYFT